MRGVFIQNQVEFRLEVHGEEFYQGDSLPCIVSLKNRGNVAKSLDNLRLHLACGVLNKVKSKARDAFTIISSGTFPSPIEISLERVESFPWTFALDKNCSITDKGQSLYLLLGSAADTEALNQLQLNVRPHGHIAEVFGVLETSFQFMLKDVKSVGGRVIAKFKPSSARQFRTLNELLLSARFDGEVLMLNYDFKVKTLEAGATSLEVKKSKKETEQRLAPEEYLFSGGFVHHSAVEAKIGDALKLVESKLLS